MIFVYKEKNGTDAITSINNKCFPVTVSFARKKKSSVKLILLKRDINMYESMMQDTESLVS